MPHLILEYSKNLSNEINFKPLFLNLHQMLAEQLPTYIASCKSRCIAHEVFFLGNCTDENTFVHLTIKILSGRSDQNKNQIGTTILQILRDFFQPHANTPLQISVEIQELDQHYFKIYSSTSLP